jgi:hypothetical protein
MQIRIEQDACCSIKGPCIVLISENEADAFRLGELAVDLSPRHHAIYHDVGGDDSSVRITIPLLPLE